MRGFVFLEVADFGIDFSEEERRVESKSDFSAPDSFHGDGAALILIF